METPFIARRWAEGQGDPLPLSDQLKIWRRYKGQGLPGQKNFCLTPQAATKFFCPPLSASSEPDTEMKCQGSPKATAQRLDLDA